MKAPQPVSLCLAVLLLGLVLSGITPYDRATWWLEVSPVLIALPLLIGTHRSFPLTPLAYLLIALHGLILLIGGHYTYARTPLGFWIQAGLDLSRNPYDRIGHLAQGFIPAILAREILLRTTPLPRGKMLFFLVICICLAISAGYELIEWGAALLFGQGAQEFLATQGDVWDTQWDMLMALLGAIVALLTLSRVHDRQLHRLLAPSVFAGGKGIQPVQSGPVGVESNRDMNLRVECYAGYRGEDTPRAFWLGEHRVTVRVVLDRWLSPAHRYFKVQAEDNGTYILRHDVLTDTWALTLFQAPHDGAPG